MDEFDEVEVYTDCTVQILHNTLTDEYSIGWTRDINMGEDWIRQAHRVNKEG